MEASVSSVKNDAILVTGASGFIGSHLTRALEARNCRVFRHDRKSGDIATCPLVFEDVGHVLHLAGRTFVQESWEQPREFYEANVLGAANVLEFCRRRNASITLISSYVYGKPKWLPIGEDHPVQAFNPYAHSKILAEEIARYYQSQFGVSLTIVRPFNIYGPGQDGPFLIPMLIRQALDPTSKQIVVADLRPRRDYLHIRDFVAMLIAAMEHPSGAILNAGSGESVSIPALVELINKMVPSSKPVVSREQFRPDEVLDVVADISRAKRELNWQPSVALAQGLSETIEWMKAKR